MISLWCMVFNLKNHNMCLKLIEVGTMVLEKIIFSLHLQLFPLEEWLDLTFEKTTGNSLHS